jgi:hypothetical protein
LEIDSARHACHEVASLGKEFDAQVFDPGRARLLPSPRRRLARRLALPYPGSHLELAFLRREALVDFTDGQYVLAGWGLPVDCEFPGADAADGVLIKAEDGRLLPRRSTSGR